MIFFSIIIPCVENSKFLYKNLRSLEKQTFNKFEVIIISENKFSNIIKKKFFKIKFLKCRNVLTPGAKRNFAAKISRGKYLAFIDDDAYADKNWLMNAYKFFQIQDNYKICLGGPGLMPEDNNFLGRCLYIFFKSKYFHSDNLRYFCEKSKNNTEVLDWPSVNFFISKFFFKKINGFDENVWPGEDSKLCNKIMKNKGKIIYKSDLIVFHYSRSTIYKHVKQIFRYGMHRGLFFKQMDKNSFNLKYIIPSIFLLSHVALIININFFLYFVLIPYLILNIFDLIENIRAEIPFLSNILGRPIIYLSHLSYGIGFIFGLAKLKYKINLYR
jgi:GT2 family glycosyltransferase